MEEQRPPQAGDGATAPELPPCMIYIDEEGRWFHKGAEIIRRDLLEMFFANLTMDAAGRYVITWDGKPCLVEVADTAYVVRSLDHRPGDNSGGERFILTLSDGSSEELDPGNLSIGDSHIPYCRVKGGRFPARFTRQAYYQLAPHVVEAAGGRYFLPLNERRYYL